MKQNKALKKLHDMTSHRKALPALALAFMVLASITSTTWASALYILTDTQETTVILEGSDTIPDLSSHLVDVTSNTRCKDLTLSEGQTVTIHYEGAVLSVQSEGETISALLDRLHIVPRRLEMVAVDLTGNGAVLTIGEDITYYESVVEADPYTTTRVPNPYMLKGTEQVVQAGVNGVCTAVYEVVWSQGEMISRQRVEEKDSTTVDEIIEYGTSTDKVGTRSPISNVTTNADGSGVLTLANGDTVAFSAVKNMTATAYTAGQSGVDHHTATGAQVRTGTVAVDRRVIPLGTKMYIVTNKGSYVYGLSVAEDTGVRGNIVDLYMPTYEDCINFGRRGVTVYILE